MTKLQVLEDLKAFLEKDKHIYDWTKGSRCNMGLLYAAANEFSMPQAAMEISKIRKKANNLIYWGELLPAVCSISGKSTEETIQKLFDLGFTLSELIGFEYLHGFDKHIKSTLTAEQLRKWIEKCALKKDAEWISKKEYDRNWSSYKVFETRSFWFGLIKEVKIVRTIHDIKSNKYVVIEYLKHWIEAVKKEEKKEFHFMNTAQIAQYSTLTCN